MDYAYKGKRVLVTGCHSGMGRSTAVELDKMGADVIGLDIVEKTDAPVSSYAQVDLSNSSSVAAYVSSFEGELDAIFNIAGVSSGGSSTERTITVNFLGMRQLTDGLEPRIVDGGAVVCVASIAAVNYEKERDWILPLIETASFEEGWAWCQDRLAQIEKATYAFAKSAVILYAMRRAVSWAERGIRVNCLGPGVTDTPFLEGTIRGYGREILERIPKPLGRFGTPEEQANALLFLNSAAASYVTGHVLWVDGGHTAGVYSGVYEA